MRHRVYFISQFNTLQDWNSSSGTTSDEIWSDFDWINSIKKNYFRALERQPIDAKR